MQTTTHCRPDKITASIFRLRYTVLQPASAIAAEMCTLLVTLVCLLQRGKRPNHADTDTAPNKLITFIKQDVWQRPSYGLFYKLLNNYTRHRYCISGNSLQGLQSCSE